MVYSFLATMMLLSSGQASGQVPDDKRVYQYESISDTSMEASRIKIELNENELIYPATVTLIEPCSKGRRSCFQSTRMSFCSPSEAELLVGKWNCGSDNLSFSVKGSASLQMLGRRIDAIVIANEGTEYFYSRTLGVVMFRLLGQQAAEVYWSVSERGFGAQVE